MTDVLILGGTGWLSGRVAERWLDAGASVTCLARGGRPVPYGARAVVADRDAADAYDAVAGRTWDEVVDVSSRAAHVTAAAAALTSSARHITYVSSVSAYARDDEPGADENAQLADPAAPDDAYDYAREKSAAEAAVQAGFAHRAAVVRPGLIVGPGDPTDRFGYWVARFAGTAGAPVLIPDAPDARAQVIDVDDLAGFIVAVGRAGFVGTANAVGDAVPLAEMLRVAREVAAHTGALVAADPEWLVAQGVEYWAGPRSLPLWLPADMPGFATRSNARYRLLGGALRPLRDTLVRTLVDERERGLDRPRAAGLSRDEELALIAALRPA
ncbi:MAG: reductase [Microbacterium sp. SCN 70-200]|uniref:NAD-dependent epimerase/dehydratase family protein n=1 Tax=unclassified Microbacterium TaxID=2609290 RepID=UPI00086A5428|nr:MULTISPECIES: NAD-dependent epimerase/dehydratase family protein [unclassified Microbacterium]MBN9214088.1 NAD-dependent epimerase/dehydratase family protein [Microbacterium sp.]ODT39717.1 MAG: reductase [Microbacterium sp. SCN 70-200]OJV82794.1 MAG: reductase [Microbacterium sp. 70-16]